MNIRKFPYRNRHAGMGSVLEPAEGALANGLGEVPCKPQKIVTVTQGKSALVQMGTLARKMLSAEI
jgi:hypothetical protein